MIIKPNKKKIPIGMLISISVSILLVRQILIELSHFTEHKYDSTLWLISLIGFFLLFGFYSIIATFDYLRMLFFKNVFLKIDERGINDRLSIFSSGHINWEDIKEVKIVQAYRSDFLVIVVLNPQLFIDKKPKFLQRPLKTSLKKFGSPVCISQKRILNNLYDIKDMMAKKIYK